MKLTIQPLEIKGLTYETTFVLEISFQEEIKAEHNRLGAASFGAMVTYDYLPVARDYARRVIEALNLTVSSDLTTVACVRLWVFNKNLTPDQCKKIITSEPVRISADGPLYNPLPKPSPLSQFWNKCRLWLVNLKPFKRTPTPPLQNRYLAERHKHGHYRSRHEMEFYESLAKVGI